MPHWREATMKGIEGADARSDTFLLCVGDHINGEGGTQRPNKRSNTFPQSAGDPLRVEGGTERPNKRPNTFPLRVGDRIKKNFFGEEYYGTVVVVGEEQDGLFLYTAIYDDGDLECSDDIDSVQVVPLLRNQEFFLYCYTRQEMWARRAYAPDALVTKGNLDCLEKYSWCNVYRQLDRGTQYFRQQVIVAFEEKQKWEEKEWLRRVLWMAICYRLVNRFETFKEIGGIPQPGRLQWFFSKMDEFRDRKPFFTRAHQTTNFQNLKKFLSKAKKHLDTVVKSIWDHTHDYTDVPVSEKIILELEKLHGIGSFYSWQIFCDLEEAGCLKKDPTFCVLGPGARGMLCSSLSYCIIGLFSP